MCSIIHTKCQPQPCAPISSFTFTATTHLSIIRPSSWAHRKWVAKKLVDLAAQRDKEYKNIYQWASSEINTCSSVAERFPKNYHAWTHRRWVLRLLFKTWISKSDSTVTAEDCIETKLIFKLPYKELENTQIWMKTHVSDLSACHYQGQVLRMLLAVGLHPTNGYFASSNDEDGITWAWDLLTKTINSARASSFLSHEVTWIHRRISSVTIINLFDGFIAADNTVPLVRFDSNTLASVMDEFVKMEVHELASTYFDSDRSSTEAAHAMSYVVWIAKQMNRSARWNCSKTMQETNTVANNIAEQLKCNESIIGNLWRAMSILLLE